MIRYFCAITPDSEGPYGGWGDVGWDYFEALREAFKIRVIPLNVVQFQGMTGRWSRHLNVFATPMDEPYTNVVCGPYQELLRLWTDGVKNVGITSADAKVSDEALQALSQYDLVCCTTPEEASSLLQSGMEAAYLQPTHFVEIALCATRKQNEQNERTNERPTETIH